VSQPRPIGLAPGAPVDATGQDAKKYSTTNPVVQRLLGRWLAALAEEIGSVDGGTLVDIGVGEGLALERVLAADGVRPAAVVGVEYRHGKVAAARQRVKELSGVVGDAGMLPLPDGSADVVTCIELLEHLVTTGPAVAELARITGDRCLVSVPWEPWFRAGNFGRAKNVRRLGNDPEHVQWFTPRTLGATLGESFADVRVRRAFPWIIAVCRKPLPKT